jgi:hypothetical protein
VTTTFANMRSAKHRIETFTKPLSRCRMNMSGLLSFLVSVAVLRKGRVDGQSGRGLPRGSMQRLVVASCNDVRC